MNDAELLRYSRQILLPEIDIQGQEKLLAARVLIVGLGGLGSPVAMYLAAAGVGRLTLVDFDRVDLSNLQRQIIHETKDIGRLKVESAKERLRRLNPTIEVQAIAGRLENDRLVEEIARVDVVVDASDNFPTRFALNQACLKAGKPLISGAAIRFEGQVTVFHPGQGDSPCYACLYPDVEETPESCTETGVAAPLLGIIGSIQAVEALKLVIGVGESLTGRLVRLDALNMEWTSTRLRKDPACRVCALKLNKPLE
jgi:adenylyltransferase/sulfurtransferase